MFSMLLNYIQKLMQPLAGLKIHCALLSLSSEIENGVLDDGNTSGSYFKVRQWSGFSVP